MPHCIMALDKMTGMCVLGHLSNCWGFCPNPNLTLIAQFFMKLKSTTQAAIYYDFILCVCV